MKRKKEKKYRIMQQEEGTCVKKIENQIRIAMRKKRGRIAAEKVRERRRKRKRRTRKR